ncbi:CynX/NimT family MFS transporter [Lichenicoccus sp.]|uniref:MFS transporter n=1 Tax=Lichenicoccus sp. TaxID=2781899 RepID=UPI003D11D2D3
MAAKVTDTCKAPAARRDFALALLLLWLSGAALRETILAMAPVLPRVTADFRLSATGVGLLTGLPPLLFAVTAVPSAALIARFGAVPTLIAGLLLNATGAAARGLVGSVVGLNAATALMCLGVAVMQPVMPLLVRAWAPAHIGFATAIYTNGLLVGELAPVVWVPQPILPLVGGGWRASLVFWALPVLTAVLLVGFRGRRPQAAAGLARWQPDWRDGRIWRMGLLLGGVNATYFGLNGFLPGWLTTTGAPELARPALTALNLAQIPASLLMLALASRLTRRPAAYAGAGALLLAGVLGCVAMPGPAAVAWAALAGFAGAILLTLGPALPSLLGEAADVSRLAAAMFTVSYGAAMGAALLAGWLSDLSGVAAMAFSPFALAALAVMLLGATLRLKDAQEPNGLPARVPTADDRPGTRP